MIRLPRPSRFAVAALAVNAVCAALLVWASTERLPVTVVVADGTVTGMVGSTAVSAPAGALDHGQIGLFLQGADPNTTVEWPTSVTDVTRPSSPTPADLLYRLGAESGWADVRVRDLTTNQVIDPMPGQASLTSLTPRFGDWFHHPLGGESTARPGLITFGSATWTSYELDADLVRPRNPAGVLVLSPDGVDGLLFYFRPEDRDAMWFQVHDGQWTGPIASAPFHAFHESAIQSVQDVLRLALGGYPGAVAIVLSVLLLGRLERVIGRRWQGIAVHRSSVTGDQRPRWSGGQFKPARPLVVAVPSPCDHSPWMKQALSTFQALPASLPTIAALGVTIVVLGSTLYVADEVLQRMPHVQDSVAYLFQAKTFALGRLWVPMPPDPDFFKHEFILMDGGRWFSKYPPGWPMLLALGVLAGAPWVVNPICGALGVFVIYRLGSDAFRPRVGVIAAVLAAASPFVLFLSGSMMSHPSGLLFAVLFAWAFWHATTSKRPTLPATLSGAAFGMGFLIRPYTMVVIALPFAIYAVYRIVREPRDLLGRYVPAAIASIPFVAAFLAYNAYFTGNPLYPPQQLWWAFDRVGFGPGNGPWGFTPIDALNNTSHNLLQLVEHTYGWPEFLTLSFAMIPFLTGRFRTWDWLLLVGFAAVVVGYGLWWADGIMYGPRFYYEGIGFLLLLTARGIDVLLDFARRVPRVVTPLAVCALVIGLIAFNAEYYFPGQWQLYHGYNYVNHSKLDAVAKAGIHHALVFADVGQWYEWWEYGMVFSANDPLLRGDVIYARDLGMPTDEKLMHDFPGRTYYRLDGTTLTPLSPTGTP